MILSFKNKTGDYETMDIESASFSECSEEVYIIGGDNKRYMLPINRLAHIKDSIDVETERLTYL